MKPKKKIKRLETRQKDYDNMIMQMQRSNENTRGLHKPQSKRH